MSRHKSKAIPGRNLRLADQIQKDLAGIIQREIDTTRAGLITLSGVELSTDYAHAKVYFTVLGAEPEAATALLNEGRLAALAAVQAAAHSYCPHFALLPRRADCPWH